MVNNEFHIIKPFDKDIFQYQEGISSQVQQIKFSAGPVEVGEKNEWFVDGEKVGRGRPIFGRL